MQPSESRRELTARPGLFWSVGCLVVVAVAALALWLPYEKERQFGVDAVSIGGHCAFLYAGPAWLPERIQTICSPLLDRIHYVHLAGSSPLTPARMRRLGTLTSAWHLDLEGTSTGDADMKLLTGLARLEWLGLRGTAVTDAAMVDVAGYRLLESLTLGGTRVSDAGLAPLSALPRLKRLYIGSTLVPLTDAGASHLGRMTTLEYLDVSGSALTDASLADLSRLKRLRYLSVEGTRITPAGLKRLRTALTLCTIWPLPAAGAP